MMRRLLLLTALCLAMVLLGCTPSSVRGRTWQPVADAEEPRGPGGGLTVVLPGETVPEMPGERVDPERFLIVGVHYEACHWAGPRLVGVMDARIEVQVTELNRMCVRPIPRVAWFALHWSELPTELTLVDQHGLTTVVQDRRRV